MHQAERRLTTSRILRILFLICWNAAKEPGKFQRDAITVTPYLAFSRFYEISK